MHQRKQNIDITAVDNAARAAAAATAAAAAAATSASNDAVTTLQDAEQRCIQVACDLETPEEGEIGSLQRLQDYYWKITNVAANMAIELNKYIPILDQIDNTPTSALRFKFAQCRTAMSSIDDILVSRRNRPSVTEWHGPKINAIMPTDLPDLDNAIKRILKERI
jgi:hypothetical protein